MQRRIPPSRLPAVVAVVVAVALLAAVVVVAARVPVLFSPGFSSNTLWGHIAPDAALPAVCDSAQLPRSPQAVLLWPNVTLTTGSGGVDPACLYELLRLDWDEPSNRYRSAHRGVEVAPAPPGNSSQLIDPAYVSFVDEYLRDALGYTPEQDLWVVGYDFRLGAQGLRDSGALEGWRVFIEGVVRANGGRAVVWIGHSNGPPSMYAFLRSVDDAWKRAHVRAFVALSGNLAGQANAVLPLAGDEWPEFVMRDATLDRVLQAGWEASYHSGPGPTGGFGDATIVTTFANSSAARMYATEQLPQLMRDSGGEGSERYARMWERAFTSGGMDRRPIPRVDTYCLYGWNVTTPFGYAWSGAVSPIDAPGGGAMPGSGTYVTGDGDQDFVDQTFCARAWTVGQRRAGFTLDARAFDGVGHMQMPTDAGVRDAVTRILQRY